MRRCSRGGQPATRVRACAPWRLPRSSAPRLDASALRSGGAQHTIPTRASAGDQPKSRPSSGGPQPARCCSSCWPMTTRGSRRRPRTRSASIRVRAGSRSPRVTQAATTHPDPLVREAAVAALGAQGDPSTLPAVLAACADKPAIRRRAVLALAAFEGEEVESRLHAALADPDWQVRQAAEDLLAVTQ